MTHDEFKELVRAKNPIQEVINEKIPLNRYHKALCPFHTENTPSFSVNIKDQYYYCFGCGQSGDVFDFVSFTQKLSFSEALKYLARRAGVQIPKEFSYSLADAQSNIELVLSEASALYHASLPANVKDYLHGRGISDEIIEAYKVGYCSGSTQYKASKDMLLQAGLIYAYGQEWFKGYITFPNIIYGRVVYISGRYFGEKKHRKLPADKVPLRHIYNETALKNKDVIVAEGEIDTLTLLTNGFNACGILGAESFNPEWKDNFRSCEAVYMSFDADDAGEKGNEKNALLLGNKAKIITLPKDTDVNDYFKGHTKEDYQKLKSEALSLIEYKIKRIPPETPPIKLPQILEPLLNEIAGLSIPQGNAILQHSIKGHFKMTDKDLKGYEKMLKSLRKQTEPEKEDQPKTQKEIMEILQNDDNAEIIHPVQDYSGGVMYYATNIEEEPYLVTSAKELISYDDAKRKGITLKTNSIDMARMSYKGIRTFIESENEINIFELYQKIYNYVGRFILFPDESYLSLITLWVMGTYVFMMFGYYPYIWLNAEKGSGKTLLMQVLARIAFNGDLVVSVTESVIFRDVSNNLITMFIDEVEQLRKRDKDIYGSIISLLNAGFSKSGKVKRTESSGNGLFTVKSYDAFSPKMFAGINDIDEVLQDRTIRIPLLRKKESEKVERYKETDAIKQLQTDIRDELYKFALTYADDIAELYRRDGEDKVEGVDHLSNRELDIWEPMMLLANIVDATSKDQANVTELMESLSNKSTEYRQNENKTQNETFKILGALKTMLEDLTPLSQDNGVCVYKTQDVLLYFQNTDGFEWIEKPNALTSRLKRVEVRSEQRRMDKEKVRVYLINMNKFNDYCERFLIE